MVILAIGAHPDDIEFGCYGTLAKLRKSHEIFFLIFSAGELGAPRQIRVQEAEKSAKLINAHLEILNYKDGSIPVNPEIISNLVDVIEKIEPDIIFTLYPYDTHQDHRAVSKVTIVASIKKKIKKILFYEVPETDQSFSPNYFVDITDFFEMKKQALMCHKSQLHKPYLDLRQIEGLARYRAYKCFIRNRLFEAFQLYRSINF